MTPYDWIIVVGLVALGSKNIRVLIVLALFIFLIGSIITAICGHSCI